MPLVAMLCAFVLGSIPFGYLIGRARGVDIRQHGSKNIGATNVGRVLGRPWGVLCFALDALKGCVPTIGFGAMIGGLGRLDVASADLWAWLGVATAAIAGHMFTPWLSFRGGKGVATGLGALAGVWPMLGIPACMALLLWVVVVRVTRYVSLASMVAAASLPITALVVPGALAAVGLKLGEGGVAKVWPAALVTALLAGVVIFKHRGNIVRLLSGTESRVGGR